MAVLILLLTWLSPVLPAMNKLPSPVILNLTSHHFIHLLTWKQGEGTPPGVSYNVSVTKTTGHIWLPVAGCQGVVDPLQCDLTEAFSDPFATYLTQVTAHLGSETSTPVYREFRPISGTVLDPPLLFVTPCGGNLCMQLKPPKEHLRDIYEHLKYKLDVRVRGNPVQNLPYSVSLDGLVLDDVSPGRQYCVSVYISDTLENKHSHPSQPVCVVTPSDFNRDVLAWSLLSVLTLLGVFALAFLACAGFICLRKRPLPSTLRSLHHIEESHIFAAPCTSSFSPLYDDKSTAPPVREKRSSSTSSSESSDEEESTPETTGGGGGGHYLSKKGTNLPSSSSSSSSSLTAAPPVPLSTFSNPPSHPFTPPPHHLPPQAQNAAETAPLTGHKHTSDTHSADQTPPSHAVCPPAGGGEEVRDSFNVNLLTLTFDREEDEEEEEKEEEEEWKRPEISSNTNPFLQPERVAVETILCPEDEKDEEEEEEEEDDDDDDDEEEEEPCGYIGH